LGGALAGSPARSEPDFWIAKPTRILALGVTVPRWWFFFQRTFRKQIFAALLWLDSIALAVAVALRTASQFLWINRPVVVVLMG